jgi:hypothetical protein
MDERVKELLAHRTVTIHLPRGGTEYWLTDRSFSAGERIRCRDRDWIIGDVIKARGSRQLTLALREPGSVEPEVEAA